MYPLNGFVIIHRKLLQWSWYKNQDVKNLFLHLIFTANFKDAPWEDQIIKRGQLITSLNHLASNTGLSVQRVRTCIKKLISTGEITTFSTSKFTVITVVKYEFYQYDDQSVTNNQQTTNKPITNNQQQRNNIKNINNDNNIYIDFTKNQNLLELLNEYDSMRSSIKKPMTNASRKMLINKLNELAFDDITKIKIVEQSIFNSWADIYELKQNKNATKFSNFTQRSDVDYEKLEQLSLQKRLKEAMPNE